MSKSKSFWKSEEVKIALRSMLIIGVPLMGLIGYIHLLSYVRQFGTYAPALLTLFLVIFIPLIVLYILWRTKNV